MSKKEVKGPRAYGKGKGLSSQDYFPNAGSLSHEELLRIVESGDNGIDISTYKVSEIFLGKAVAAGLVNVNDGKLYTSQRTLDILNGKIETKRGSIINRLMKAVKEAKNEKELKEAMAALQEAKSEQLAS